MVVIFVHLVKNLVIYGRSLQVFFKAFGAYALRLSSRWGVPENALGLKFEEWLVLWVYVWFEISSSTNLTPASWLSATQYW